MVTHCTTQREDERERVFAQSLRDRADRLAQLARDREASKRAEQLAFTERMYR